MLFFELFITCLPLDKVLLQYTQYAQSYVRYSSSKSSDVRNFREKISDFSFSPITFLVLILAQKSKRQKDADGCGEDPCKIWRPSDACRQRGDGNAFQKTINPFIFVHFEYYAESRCLIASSRDGTTFLLSSHA